MKLWHLMGWRGGSLLMMTMGRCIMDIIYGLLKVAELISGSILT